MLNISKTRTLNTHRLKSTKTEREDIIYISCSLAKKLFNLSPNSAPDDFIFSNVTLLEPIKYYKIKIELGGVLKKDEYIDEYIIEED